MKPRNSGPGEAVSGDVRRGPSPERLNVMKMCVNGNCSEFLEVDTEVGVKIEHLLNSQEDIKKVDDIERLLSTGDKIAGANCHKTALYLTGKISEEQLFDLNNDNVETAGHREVEESSMFPEDLTEELRKKRFPFRISFFKMKDGTLFAYHSITILGNSNEGRLVAFEKEGPYADTPFRYVDVMEVITVRSSAGFSIGLEK